MLVYVHLTIKVFKPIRCHSIIQTYMQDGVSVVIGEPAFIISGQICVVLLLLLVNFNYSFAGECSQISILVKLIYLKVTNLIEWYI